MAERLGSDTATGTGSIAQQADELDDCDVWIKKLGTTPVFKQIATSLKDLEFSLRCFQCKNFLRAPVSVIPCQHTYCSECIRIKFAQDLHSTARKASCSLCNVAVDTGGNDFGRCLRPNHNVDRLVILFRLLRQPLLEKLLSFHSSAESGDESTLLSAVKRASEAAETVTMGGSSIDQAAVRVIDGLHAITLTIGGLEMPQLPSALPTRAKLTRVMYKGKKKSQLVELCRAAGLSTSGDESELLKRHSEYITLYNSECDSLRPRSNSELLAIINARDRARGQRELHIQPGINRATDQTRYHRLCLEKLKQERKKLGESSVAFWSTVTTGYADFDEKLKEGFTHLIRSYQERFPPTPRKPWVDTTDYEAIAAEAAKPTPAQQSRKPKKRLSSFFVPPKVREIPASTTKENMSGEDIDRNTVSKSLNAAISKRYAVQCPLTEPPCNAKTAALSDGSQVASLVPRFTSQSFKELGVVNERLEVAAPLQLAPPLPSQKLDALRGTNEESVVAVPVAQLPQSLAEKFSELRDVNARPVVTEARPHELLTDAQPQELLTETSGRSVRVEPALPVVNDRPTLPCHTHKELGDIVLGVAKTEVAALQVVVSETSDTKRKAQPEQNHFKRSGHKSPKTGLVVNESATCARSPNSGWTCGACTFINPERLSSTRCEMCETKRSAVQVDTTVYEIE
jgi:hypothetical protein